MWNAWERRGKCKKFWWKSQKERDHLKDQGVDGRMGLEWMLGRLAGGCGVESLGSGWGPVAGFCEYGDEPSGSGAALLDNTILHTAHCYFMSSIASVQLLNSAPFGTSSFSACFS
jgi:hypothetical protein